MLKQQVPCQTLGLSTPKKEMLKTSCPQSAPKSEVKIQTVWTQKITGRGESLGRFARAAGDAGVPWRTGPSRQQAGPGPAVAGRGLWDFLSHRGCASNCYCFVFFLVFRFCMFFCVCPVVLVVLFFWYFAPWLLPSVSLRHPPCFFPPSCYFSLPSRLPLAIVFPVLVVLPTVLGHCGTLPMVPVLVALCVCFHSLLLVSSPLFSIVLLLSHCKFWCSSLTWLFASHHVAGK